MWATYFKVLRKERFLLYVNIISMALSIALSIFGAYGLHSIDSIILFMVCSIGVRYFISQIYLERLLGEASEQAGARVGMAEELVLVVVCAYACWKLHSGLAFVITAIVYLIYLVINRKSVGYLWGMVKAKIRK